MIAADGDSVLAAIVALQAVTTARGAAAAHVHDRAREMRTRLDRVARASCTVLVTGEAPLRVSVTTVPAGASVVSGTSVTPASATSAPRMAVRLSAVRSGRRNSANSRQRSASPRVA
mgnify:CR=1 FL=1